MQAIILVAGRGKRMEGLTDSTPKPMLRVAGKPLLEHKLDSLPKEIDEVILVVGYKKEVIKKYFGDRYRRLKITYVEQKHVDGTAGAIRSAKGCLNDTFLVLMGDDLYHKDDLEKLLHYTFAILTYQTKSAQHFGIVEMDSEGNFMSIIERPHTRKEGLVNTGCVCYFTTLFQTRDDKDF